jgi:DNA-binding MarR family transcriptional regulator
MKKNPHGEKSSQIFHPTDAFRAYWWIQQTHNVVNRIVSKKLAQWGLSVPKYGIIRQLYDNETLPLSKLSKLIFRGNSNLTTLVDRMERDGIVQRVNHRDDRRVKVLCLTKKGRELAPKVIKEYRAFLHQMMCCLSTKEQRILVQALKRLNERLEE